MPTRLYVVARLTQQLLGWGCSIGHRVGIGHNCKIASNVFIGTGSTVLGSVTINENVWIGPGSSILNKIHVGKNATVGLGSVVTQNVAINTAVFGLSSTGAEAQFISHK